MKCVLVGSRYFGATVLEALRKQGIAEFTRVIAPDAHDRLALAARAAGLDVHILADPKIVPGEAVPEGTELILAAHTHARVSNAALGRARLGGVGYHPSLLPRHRGIAAVEWTILEGDPVAGGSIYHLADGWDAGAVAAQDWCFVAKGESARDLWERALAPMGLRLMERVVEHAHAHGELPAHAQDARFATKAPMLRRAVKLTEGEPTGMASLVVTVIGTDRPGIVRALAERVHRHGASWDTSHLARLGGEFAGVVHVQVPRDGADALVASLQALESAGLRLVVARSEAGGGGGTLRGLDLELVGADRPGIVSSLTQILAAQGISFESLHTETLVGQSDKSVFKVRANLQAPRALQPDALRAQLELLAKELMLDINLGERAAAAP